MEYLKTNLMGNISVFLLAFILLFSSIVSIAQKIAYAPPEYKLTTEWTFDVNPDSSHPEYPRPGLVRPEWKSLNGRWYFAKTEKDENQPDKYNGLDKKRRE